MKIIQGGVNPSCGETLELDHRKDFIANMKLEPDNIPQIDQHITSSGHTKRGYWDKMKRWLWSKVNSPFCKISVFILTVVAFIAYEAFYLLDAEKWPLAIFRAFAVFQLAAPLEQSYKTVVKSMKEMCRSWISYFRSLLRNSDEVLHPSQTPSNLNAPDTVWVSTTTQNLATIGNKSTTMPQTSSFNTSAEQVATQEMSEVPDLPISLKKTTLKTVREITLSYLAVLFTMLMQGTLFFLLISVAPTETLFVVMIIKYFRVLVPPFEWLCDHFKIYYKSGWNEVRELFGRGSPESGEITVWSAIVLVILHILLYLACIVLHRDGLQVIYYILGFLYNTYLVACLVFMRTPIHEIIESSVAECYDHVKKVIQSRVRDLQMNVLPLYETNVNGEI